MGVGRDRPPSLELRRTGVFWPPKPWRRRLGPPRPTGGPSGAALPRSGAVYRTGPRTRVRIGSNRQIHRGSLRKTFGRWVSAVQGRAGPLGPPVGRGKPSAPYLYLARSTEPDPRGRVWIGSNRQTHHRIVEKAAIKVGVFSRRPC